MSGGVPGELLLGEGDLLLNDGRQVTEVRVTNTGDRAVQIGSHFHLFEANRALHFDRRAAFGKRLNIPSGTAVRFEAGQTHHVELVPFGGRRVILGFNGLAGGGGIEAAMIRARAAGFVADNQETA